VLNGLLHSAPEPEIVRAMIAIANGSMGERDLAVWFRETSTKIE
jgi:hypothetical protein